VPAGTAPGTGRRRLAGAAPGVIDSTAVESPRAARASADSGVLLSLLAHRHLMLADGDDSDRREGGKAVSQTASGWSVTGLRPERG